MKSTVQIINWKGMPCLQLSSGGYTAWIAPEIGSNVIRLFHEEKGLEFFRFRAVLDSNESLSDIKTESKAKVSEVDAFEAASDLVQSQNQLAVSRQIYSMLSKQSLFDYI